MELARPFRAGTSGGIGGSGRVGGGPSAGVRPLGPPAALLARHRALREELAVFWYWRQRLDEAGDVPPEEEVRWHQSLRTSAQA
jgi:hypothetical protein